MKISLMLSFCFFSQLLFAQVDTGMESNVFRLEKGYFDSHRVLIGRKIPPEEVKGDFYLDSAWHEGTFEMKDGRTSATYPIRYDVENALLEIKWQGQVKVVGEEYLDSFQWYEESKVHPRSFHHGRDFNLKLSPVAGFLELVYAGSDSLLVRHGTTLKQPDYVAGLDMGSRHAEIIKTRQIFVLSQGELREINNLNDFLSYAHRLSKKELRRTLRKENLKFRELDDLVVLMKYYEAYPEDLK